MLLARGPGAPRAGEDSLLRLATGVTRLRPRLPARGVTIARLRAVPAPLAALLAIAAIELFAWALFNPPLQTGDESGHLAYVQKLVDAHVMPWPAHTRLARDNGSSISTELGIFEIWSGLEPLRGNLAARPLWTSADEALWQR